MATACATGMLFIGRTLACATGSAPGWLGMAVAVATAMPPPGTFVAMGCIGMDATRAAAFLSRSAALRFARLIAISPPMLQNAQHKSPMIGPMR